MLDSVLLNLLVIEYPASVWMDADDDERLAAALTSTGIVFVLAIVDMFTSNGQLKTDGLVPGSRPVFTNAFLSHGRITAYPLKWLSVT
jgi:hypothetical protein